jgi:hypothetical protein
MKKHHKKNGQIGGNSLTMVKSYFPKVERVEDADKPAIVEVTKVDVDNATRKNHRVCALALACKRFFDADGVIIGLTTSWIIREKVATRFHNAGTVSREITSFDRGAIYDVGFYLLTPASPTARLGTIRATNPKRSGKNTGGLKRRFRHYTRNVRTTLGHATSPEVA